MSVTERIGLLGGTFDPIHGGHLRPLLEIAEPLGWSTILLVPAHHQPFKLHHASASAFHRFAMIVLAILDEPKLRVTPIELERGGVSYTVDTLETLRGQWPDATLDWIVGDDILEGLEQWRRIDRVLELANLVVLRRGEKKSKLPERFQARVTEAGARLRAGGIVFAHNEVVTASATEIRQKIGSGESLGDLVNPRVMRHIEQYGLYR